MSFFKFVRSGKLTKLGQQIKSEIKAEQEIKGDGLRPLLVESFVYSQSHGVGGTCFVIGGVWWTWHSSKKQCKRILSNLNITTKWQEKIDDDRAKTILDCDSVKIAMLVQDTDKEKVDESSTKIHKAYEVFLDTLRQESKDDLRKEELQNHIAKLQSHKKGELLVLMVDGGKEEEKERGDASEESGESGFVAFRKRWFPLPWEQWVKQDKEVRRQDDWRKWIHTSGGVAADSGSSVPVASTTSSMVNVSLNESATSISSAPTDAQVEVAAGGVLHSTD